MTLLKVFESRATADGASIVSSFSAGFDGKEYPDRVTQHDASLNEEQHSRELERTGKRLGVFATSAPARRVREAVTRLRRRLRNQCPRVARLPVPV